MRHRIIRAPDDLFPRNLYFSWRRILAPSAPGDSPSRRVKRSRFPIQRIDSGVGGTPRNFTRRNKEKRRRVRDDDITGASRNFYTSLVIFYRAGCLLFAVLGSKTPAVQREILKFKVSVSKGDIRIALDLFIIC